MKKEKALKKLDLFSALDTIPLLDEFEREYQLQLQKKDPVMLASLAEMGYGLTEEPRFLRSPAVHLTGKFLALKKFEARPYIISIVRQALRGNSIILLPTGLGKTYVGILLILETYKADPFHKILIMAPTKPLCIQHKDTFREVLPDLVTNNLTGKVNPKQRVKLWQDSDIIIATPETIREEIKKGTAISNAMDLSFIFIDEIHHLTGDYAYGPVTKYYAENNSNILTVGFTASTNPEIVELERMQKELNVKDSQVVARGYDSPDIKPYVFVRFTLPVLIDRSPTDRQRRFKVELIEILTRHFTRLSQVSGESLNDYAHRNLAGKVVGIKISAFNGLMARLRKLLANNSNKQMLGTAMIDWAIAMKIGNAIDRLNKGMPEFIFFMQKQYAAWHKNPSPSGSQFVNHPVLRKMMGEVITKPIREKLQIELGRSLEKLGNLLEIDMSEYSHRNNFGNITVIKKQPFKELGKTLKDKLEKETINQKPIEVTVNQLIAWSLIMRIQAAIDCLGSSIFELVNYLQYQHWDYQSQAQPSSILFIENNNIRQIMAWLVHYNIWKDRTYPNELGKVINIGGEIDWEEAWHDPKLLAIADRIDELEKRQMLIFVKYRDTLRKVLKFIHEKYPKITCDRLTGTSNNYGDPGMKQSEQIKVLERYKAKEIQILIATSIGEEGLDFPAVDELISYEPISDVRRHIQRLGRTGRHRHGKVYTLIYKDTGEETIYHVAKAGEKAVRKIISYYQNKAN